jgi:hypothetical protein
MKISSRVSVASYTAALPTNHHIPWGEFRTAFCAQHLSASLLCRKLKEFLNLEQGNRSMLDYTRQFNTLAQYGSYHVDTDDKKANLFHEGLAIQLQDRLVQSPNLSYNELAVVEAEEKRRKRMMPGSSASGGSSDAPPKYRMVYTPPWSQLRRPKQ